MKRLVCTSELAQMMGISKQHCCRLVASREIAEPDFVLGKQQQFAWLEETAEMVANTYRPLRRKV